MPRAGRRGLSNSELQIFVANLFNQQPPRVIDGVVGFDPYNNPPNERTIGFILTK